MSKNNRQNSEDSLVFSNAILEGFLNYAKKHSDNYEIFIERLDVDPKWLRDKTQWCNAEFLQHFFLEFEKVFPDDDQAIKKSAASLYEDNRNPFFTSITGLLLKPSVIFSSLPKMAKRMNAYNSYEFKLHNKKFMTTHSTLIQKYSNKNDSLNPKLCDSARGSIEGIVCGLGYQLIELSESKCVRNGDEICEYNIKWGK